VAVGNGGNHPLASWTASAQARRFGVDPGFINEHYLADLLGMGQKPSLAFAPNYARRLHIRAILFTGVCGFFKAGVPGTEPVINLRCWRNYVIDLMQAL